MAHTAMTEDNLDAFVNALNNGSSETENNNNLPNSALINVKTVNTSGPEWDIPIGNEPNTVIPANLRPARKGGKSRRRRHNKRRSTRRRRRLLRL
jgi:hypothetical protein